MRDLEAMRNDIRQAILRELDFGAELSDADIEVCIDRHIVKKLDSENIAACELVKLRRDIFNSLRRLDVLTDLLEDDEITEIMVNGYNRIYIEKDGKLQQTDIKFESEERLMSVIQQIVVMCNRRINEASPIVDARLRDGSRVNIVLSPIAVDGHTVTIRKFPKKNIDMDKLIELGALDYNVAKLLKALVIARYNIFISGGTGSGKTTFLNALSNYIPEDERVITIEDSAELRLDRNRNLVRLEARNANVEGDNAISIRDLIKSSLRMRPDRIVVGEVRDEATIDMLTAMTTGHDGSLSTAHANSSEDMLMRLETMYLMGMEIPVSAIRRQIAAGIDIMVHLGRLSDKSRRVLNISEVVGVDKEGIHLNTLYEFVNLGEDEGRIVGRLQKVNDIRNIYKLEAGGTLKMYQEATNE